MRRNIWKQPSLLMATPEGSFARPLPEPGQTDKEPLETTVVIPYIQRVSKPIRRILAPLNDAFVPIGL